jgi:hypothetical protein
MMTSIYYLYAFHRDFRNKFAIFSFIAAALSVLANYVLLNYVLALFVIILALYGYETLQKSSGVRQLCKKAWPVSVLFGLLMLGVLPIAFQLRDAGALFFGGQSFWKDTIHSLVDRSFYELGYNYWFQRAAKLYIFLVLAGAVVFACMKIRKKQFSPNKLFLISMLLILAMCCVGLVLQHELLDTLYLVERTAILFIVLFSIILVFFIHEVAMEKPTAAFVTHVSAFAMSIHMLLSLNLSYVLEWKLNANTKEMLQDLERIKQVPPEKSTVSMNIPLPFETDINFYRVVNQLTWLNPVIRSKERNRLDDYYFLTQKELAGLAPDSIEVLKTYPITQNVLIRPKYRFNTVRTAIEQELNFEKEPQHCYVMDKDMEYSKELTYEIDEHITKTKNAVVVFEVEAKPVSLKNCDVGMVISLSSRLGTYLWTRMSAMDYLKDTNSYCTLSLSSIIPAQFKTGDKLSIYLWNVNKQELFVKKMRFKWLEYQ